MHPGDVYAINDPYAGGTHFTDVRLIRPIFVDDEIIAFSQSNGHWSDIGGTCLARSTSSAKDMFREGLRITPVRLFDKGRFCRDVAHLIASNTRDPASIIGDMHAQAEATNGLRARDPAAGRQIRQRHGRAGLARCRTMSSAPCANGSPHCRTARGKRRTSSTAILSGGEGMIPIKVKTDDSRATRSIYDFTGSHPTIGSIYNSAFGATFSACVAGMKTFFPDLPLNSGFYRVFEVIAPTDTVVEREMAGRRDRLPDAVREDHELDLRDLVRHHAASGDLLHFQH